MRRILAALLCGCVSLVIAASAYADSRYRDYHGYKERPYDRGRHYGHYKHKGHKYEYHGHWRSWNDWDRYHRKYPRVQRHGRYYHDGAHLMYRYCDPAADSCVFFSIGR